MNLKRHIKKFRAFHEQYIQNPKDPNEEPKEIKKKKRPDPDPEDEENEDSEDENEEKDIVTEMKEYFEKQKKIRNKWRSII